MREVQTKAHNLGGEQRPVLRAAWRSGGIKWQKKEGGKNGPMFQLYAATVDGNRGDGETATQVAPSHNVRSNYCPSRESPPHTVHKSLRRRNGIIVSVM